MRNIELYEEMQLPCRCRCGKWFDLNDGYGSEKWCPNEIICKSCHHEEQTEIERDEQIEEAKNALEDAVYTLNAQIENLDNCGVVAKIELFGNKVRVHYQETQTGPEGDK